MRISDWSSDVCSSDLLPVLGICGGQQLLNVVLGGTLIQHIPDEVQNALAHEQSNPRHEAGHDVDLAADSLLRAICRTAGMAVNSARSEEHTSELQSLVRISYAVFCLTQKNNHSHET